MSPPGDLGDGGAGAGGRGSGRPDPLRCRFCLRGLLLRDRSEEEPGRQAAQRHGAWNPLHSGEPPPQICSQPAQATVSLPVVLLGGRGELDSRLTLYPIRTPPCAPPNHRPVLLSPGLWGAEVLGLGAQMNLAVCGEGPPGPCRLWTVVLLVLQGAVCVPGKGTWPPGLSCLTWPQSGSVLWGEGSTCWGALRWELGGLSNLGAPLPLELRCVQGGRRPSDDLVLSTDEETEAQGPSVP